MPVSELLPTETVSAPRKPTQTSRELKLESGQRSASEPVRAGAPLRSATRSWRKRFASSENKELHLLERAKNAENLFHVFSQ
ncbi:MAG: hypothetical protein ACP5IG_00595 [Candidatus Micrarchaeia archaeon]